MSLVWLIYIYGIIDRVSGFFICISALCLVLVVACFVVISSLIYDMGNMDRTEEYGISEEERSKRKSALASEVLRNKKLRKNLCIAFFLGFFVFITISVAIPSSKTFAAMALIPKMAQNKDMQKLPSNVAKTLNLAVENWGKSLAKDVVK